MNAASVTIHDGFTLVRLENEFVSLAIAPQLGAKIVSLLDRRKGREWIWHPPGPLRLWRNSPDDAFDRSTIVGADECLPTVTACAWNGRALPDHGEVWSVPWTLDEAAMLSGEIRTAVRLHVSPFLFTRSVRLRDATVEFDYSLQNTGTLPEAWLWAFHPLLAFEPGDRLELPADVTELWIEDASRPGARRGDHWRWPAPYGDVQLDAFGLESDAAQLKAFAGPLREGWARIAGACEGDGFTLRWSVGENPQLGLWLTRGGYHGWHHAALEPSNSSTSALDTADRKLHLRRLAPRATASWSMTIALG